MLKIYSEILKKELENKELAELACVIKTTVISSPQIWVLQKYMMILGTE